MEIETQRLRDAFSETVGEAKAQEAMDEAIASAGVDGQRVLTKEEAMAVTAAIADSDDIDTLVRVSANTLQTQIRTGDIEA